MKTLTELYDEIEKDNIKVVNMRFRKKKAAIIQYNNQTEMLLDYSKIKNAKEEKIVVAEEKAHYDTGALYQLDSPLELIEKMEYKAIKKAYNELIPYSTLKELSSFMNVEELSEYFDVPIKDIIIASFLYQNIENFSTERK